MRCIIPHVLNIPLCKLKVNIKCYHVSSQHVYTPGNHLHQGPSYNRPDLNTYTCSQHVYTPGNYLHQGP
jgi:hypothetical protein